MPNIFLEKTIESWLTKTNELGYTLPFAEVLVSQGHAVIYVSKQNAFEQGKDLISIAPDGRVFAYQLKGGNITDHRWWSEVKASVDKLREVPVIHPSIPAGTKHTSVLVTNGIIDDTVRRTITDLNNGPWKKAKLKTVVQGELLRQFIDVSAAFVPQQLVDYRAFLDLFFADGKGFVDDEKLTALLEDVLALKNDELKPAARKRNIAAAILYGSYAFSSAAATENHVACIHALIRITGYVFALASRYDLHSDYWADSVRLLLDMIDAYSAKLEAEMLAGGYDDLARDVWDGTLATYRRSAALDALVASKLSQLLANDTRWKSIDIDRFEAWNFKALALWGEAAALRFVLRFWLFHALAPSNDAIFNMLTAPPGAIAKANGPEGDPLALRSPYYDLDAAVRIDTQPSTAPVGESFRGHSYTIGSLVDLLARHDQRPAVEPLWARITYIAHVEYQPAEEWEYFRRRGETGREVSGYPNQTRSWSAMTDDAKRVDRAAVPKFLLAYPAFLPFFVLGYPHHVGRNLVRHIDDLVLAATTEAPPEAPPPSRRRAPPPSSSPRESSSKARPRRRSRGK